MKLTESRIKQIILEELHNLAEEEQEEQPPAQEAPPEQNLQTDVANVMKFMPKIDNVKEYGELVTLIAKHDFGNDGQKVAVLKKLRDMIIQLVK
jgi:hypothetical protein|tara:strand:+ start:25 stop:306 length:282 start_codon:yes stop_codon:yes gene_type:complete